VQTPGNGDYTTIYTQSFSPPRPLLPRCGRGARREKLRAATTTEARHPDRSLADERRFATQAHETRTAATLGTLNLNNLSRTIHDFRRLRHSTPRTSGTLNPEQVSASDKQCRERAIQRAGEIELERERERERRTRQLGLGSVAVSLTISLPLWLVVRQASCLSRWTASCPRRERGRDKRER
jgi:hypothetical protein